MIQEQLGSATTTDINMTGLLKSYTLSFWTRKLAANALHTHVFSLSLSLGTGSSSSSVPQRPLACCYSLLYKKLCCVVSSDERLVAVRAEFSADNTSSVTRVQLRAFVHSTQNGGCLASLICRYELSCLFKPVSGNQLLKILFIQSNK